VVIPVGNTPPNPAGFHAVFALNTNIPANQGSALQIDVSGDSEIGAANMGINPTHAGIVPSGTRVFVSSADTVQNDGITLNPGGVDLVTAFTPAFDSPAATGLGTPTVFTLPNAIPNQSVSITDIKEAGDVVSVTLSAPLIKAQAGGTIVIANVVAPPPSPVPAGYNPDGYDGSFTITSVVGTTIQYVDSFTQLTEATSGTATIPIPLSCSYRPDYVTTTQATAVFVANYGYENDPNCNLASTDSVAILSPANNGFSLIQYLPAASHPVAMVETPDAQNLYVLNQNNTILDLSPTDLSTLANITPATVWNTPVWATARVDAQRVYIVTQGDGLLHTINTQTNAEIPPSRFVGGPGANYVLYDKSRNRLYVTNPGNGSSAGAVYVFDATADPPTPLGSATGVVNIPVPSACVPATPCGPVAPVSVAALPDGSRFYVASYAIATGTCPDANVTTAGCMIPQLTVFDAPSLTVKPSSPALSMLPPSVSLLAQPQYAATQFAIPLAAPGTTPSPCVPAATYTPETYRFRMFTTNSSDGSHVYVSICDAGEIADINTTTTTLPTGGTNTPDVLVIDLASPLGAGMAGANGEPGPQNPTFLLAGQ
jgi:hypothetical protein